MAIELQGAIEQGFEEVLTPTHSSSLRSCKDASGRDARSCSRPAPVDASALRAGELLDFLPETREVREGDWASRARPRRPEAALGRDHRADRPEDGDQRAQLGRRRVHGRLRGRQLAHLAQHGRRPHQPARRDRADDHPPRFGRQAVRARSAIPPRCSYAPEAGTCPSATCSSAASRFQARCSTSACTSSTAPRGCCEPARAVLLPAKDGVASRGAALERRLLVRPGCARHRAGHDQGHRPDRDAAGRVRDGRDPVRAARALGRAQRRPVGLHLLGDQVLSRAARDGAAGSRRCDDDGAVHARLHRAAGRDLPPARELTRWAGWRP